jgi:large conductance mechanosensitive channel
MLQEFKDFVAKGNMMELALAVIVGAAFAPVIGSLVGDILMPIIGFIFGGVDFSNYFWALDGSSYATLAAAQEAGAATVNYGLFITFIINFLIIAWIVFIIGKALARMKKAEEAAPTPPPAEEVLLTEIRDLLKSGR